MPETETDLKEELEQYRREKDKIRQVVGQIGGKGSARRDACITLAFVVGIVLVFVLDVLRHLLGIDVPLPPLFSLELGVLLVSLKIIWMIHKQGKVEHFQFWILHSIEYRLNDIGERMRKLELD